MAVYGLRPKAILKRLYSDIFKQYYCCIKQYQLSKNKVVVFRRKAMMQIICLLTGVKPVLSCISMYRNFEPIVSIYILYTSLLNWLNIPPRESARFQFPLSKLHISFGHASGLALTVKTQSCFFLSPFFFFFLYQIMSDALPSVYLLFQNCVFFYIFYFFQLTTWSI